MNKLRAKHMATLYLHECANMREVADLTGFSVFTVHRNLTRVLPKVDAKLARQVQAKIDHNWKERARHGDIATRDRRRKEGGD